MHRLNQDSVSEMYEPSKRRVIKLIDEKIQKSAAYKTKKMVLCNLHWVLKLRAIILAV